MPKVVELTDEEGALAIASCLVDREGFLEDYAENPALITAVLDVIAQTQPEDFIERKDIENAEYATFNALYDAEEAVRVRASPFFCRAFDCDVVGS
jgi:hypothetical protein